MRWIMRPQVASWIRGQFVHVKLFADWYRRRFDSELMFLGDPLSYAENGILYLRQRVSIFPVEPNIIMPYGNSTLQTVISQLWSRREWQQFVTQFKDLCELYWNTLNRVWLEPPDTFN